MLKKEQSGDNSNNNSNNNTNLERSYTYKKARHEPSDWAMLTRYSLDEEEKKLDYCRGKDCID